MPRGVDKESTLPYPTNVVHYSSLLSCTSPLQLLCTYAATLHINDLDKTLKISCSGDLAHSVFHYDRHRIPAPSYNSEWGLGSTSGTCQIFTTPSFPAVITLSPEIAADMTECV